MPSNLTEFLIFTAAVALFYYVITIIRERKERLKVYKRGNVPSLPVKNILLGNIVDTIGNPDNCKILDRHHKALGDTFGTFYGPYPWAFTCDPELLHRLFVIESNKFVNLNDYHLPYTAEIDKSLAQLRDDEWRIMRKALNPSFSMKQMKSDNVNRDIEELTRKMITEVIEASRVERLEPSGDAGRIVDVLYLARRYSVSVLYRVAFGGGNRQDLTPEAIDKLIKLVDIASNQGANTFPVHACIALGDWSKRLFRQLLPLSSAWPSMQAISRLTRESVANRRAMSKQEIESDRKMIDTILETVKRHKLGEDILNSNLFFFFLAGYDTTSTSSAILLWLLARHPERQEKLRASIIAEGQASEYLTWCVMESLRLYPSVPTGIGRELSEDYHYNGMTFFKGTSIVGTTYTMHRLEKYWGHDASEFRPERHGEPLKHPFQYLPFGGGPRICIGMNLALTEIKNIVAQIVIMYRLVVLGTTPKQIDFTSPNLFQMIVHGKIEVGLVRVQK